MNKSNFKLISILVITALILGVALFTIFKRAGERKEGKISLTAMPAKTSFKLGEEIAINLKLTNMGDDTCLSNMSSANIKFLSLTRDGRGVATRKTPSYYLTSFQKMLESSLVKITTGNNLVISLTSLLDSGLGVQTLQTTAPDNNRGLLTFYDVGKPGKYTLELMYQYPGSSSAVCPKVFKDATNASIATFTITP